MRTSKSHAGAVAYILENATDFTLYTGYDPITKNVTINGEYLPIKYRGQSTEGIREKTAPLVEWWEIYDSGKVGMIHYLPDFDIYIEIEKAGTIEYPTGEVTVKRVFPPAL